VEDDVITRIRISGIKPGTLPEFTAVARDWKNLLERHGGRVIGFYFNENDNRVTGIAEYDSRARLSEIQRSCEADPAYAQIQSRAEQMTTSFEEWILDKLDVDR
jgi:NIPSNAP